jgi:hypothetical protein
VLPYTWEITAGSQEFPAIRLHRNAKEQASLIWFQKHMKISEVHYSRACRHCNLLE